MTDDDSAEELERERRARLIDEARATVERLKDVEKRREEIQSLPPSELSRRLIPACADDAVERWAAMPKGVNASAERRSVNSGAKRGATASSASDTKVAISRPPQRVPVTIGTSGATRASRRRSTANAMRWPKASAKRSPSS